MPLYPLAEGGLTTGILPALMHPHEAALPLNSPRTIDALSQALAKADREPATIVYFRPQVNIMLPPGTPPEKVPLFVRPGVRAVEAEFEQSLRVGTLGRALRRGGR